MNACLCLEIQAFTIPAIEKYALGDIGLDVFVFYVIGIVIHYRN